MTLPAAFKIPYYDVKINDKKERRYADADELFLQCKSAYEYADTNQGEVASVSGNLLDGKLENTVMKIYLTKENELPYLYIRYTPVE